MMAQTEISNVQHGKGEFSRELTAAESEHTDMLFTMFFKHLTGIRANKPNSAEAAIDALRTFLKYVGLPPWEWDEHDLSDFLSFKVIQDDIGLSRQSAYITYLRSFQNYMLFGSGISNSIHQKFGIRLKPFVNDENSISIKRKKHQRKKEIRSLTEDECNRLIDEFDAAISQAKMTGSKSYNPLRRDKALVVTILLTGLRINEAVHLTLNSFREDLSYANFGNFALLEVLGKGSKLRCIRLFDPFIRETMEWYLDGVRPKFLHKNIQDVNLLFISQKSGGVIDQEQIRRRVRDIALRAGISILVSPHLLRHTYGTHMANVIGPEALQHQLGHESLTTTLGTYYHPDPENVGNEIRSGVDKITLSIDKLSRGL